MKFSSRMFLIWLVISIEINISKQAAVDRRAKNQAAPKAVRNLLKSQFLCRILSTIFVYIVAKFDPI